MALCRPNKRARIQLLVRVPARLSRIVTKTFRDRENDSFQIVIDEGHHRKVSVGLAKTERDLTGQLPGTDH